MPSAHLVLCTITHRPHLSLAAMIWLSFQTARRDLMSDTFTKLCLHSVNASILQGIFYEHDK